MDLKDKLRDERQKVLVRLALVGHERAFRALYGELYELVSGYLAARVRPAEDAEDITSRVFQKFLVSLDRYDSAKGSVRTWVMTMARNTMLDHFRAVRHSDPLEDYADRLEDPKRSPLELLIDDEAGRFVSGVLSRYPEEVQEMFSMHFSHGLTYREISAVLGISEAAVKKRFSRTLEQLRLELEEQRTQRRRGTCALEN